MVEFKWIYQTNLKCCSKKVKCSVKDACLVINLEAEQPFAYKTHNACQ